MAKRLIVATGNSGKAKEFRQIVGSYFEKVCDLSDFPEIVPAEENGSTFEENSALKAFAVSSVLPGDLVVADDSGLEVDVLGGSPGVYSARFAGPDSSDANNRTRLIEELLAADMANGKDAATGRFRCVLTVAKAGKKLAVFDGVCEGKLVTEERGSGGFGYDPLFVPEGYHETFGQLAAEVKNKLSHRGQALEQFCRWVAQEQA